MTQQNEPTTTFKRSTDNPSTLAVIAVVITAAGLVYGYNRSDIEARATTTAQLVSLTNSFNEFKSNTNDRWKLLDERNEKINMKLDEIMRSRK